MKKRAIQIVPSHLRGMEMVAADTDFSFVRHTHDQFGIGLMDRGAQKSLSGRGRVESSAGDIITVNPGKVHDGSPLSGARAWRMIYLQPERLNQCFADECRFPVHLITDRYFAGDRRADYLVITLSTGLQQGTRSALVAATGCTLGVLPHMLAAVTGLAALLQTSALAFDLVKYLGVVYLLFMGWQTLREKGPLALSQANSPSTDGALVRYAVIANALNPKLSIFFLAFLPQFITAGEPHPVRTMLRLSAVFAVMTFVIFSLYGAFAARVRHRILGNTRVMNWIRWSVSLAFIGLAIKLALTSH